MNAGSVNACIEPLTHPRLSECLRLYESGFHKQAAFEAMKEVELALKERTNGEENVFGVRLVRQLFDERRGFYLQLELDPQKQVAGRKLFEGAFGYYRNYAAHDGTRITARVAARILVVASELLEMLGASERRVTGKEGVEEFATVHLGDGGRS